MDSQKKYLGYSLEEITRSGRDILGERIMQSGKVTSSAIRGVLPDVERGKYFFLSGRASWHGLILYPDGRVVPQEREHLKNPTALFSPLEEDGVLGAAAPTQTLLDGWIPIVNSEHRLGNHSLEILYFVEYGDPDADPQLWIRVRRRNSDEDGSREENCYVVSRSRPIRKRRIHSEEFEAVRETTELEWRNLGSEFHNFKLPDKQLETSLKAMLCNLFSTFSGDHAHYGHFFYGREIHDNFPPSYLSAIETCHTLGMTRCAWNMLQHLFRFCIDITGKFCYRQGSFDFYGASGSEYGKLLWLIDRLHRSCPEIYTQEIYGDKVKKIADYLISQISPDPCGGGARLLRMCAEADTRSRVHAYTSNNLWAVNGLNAAARLLRRIGDPAFAIYEQTANGLFNSLRSALDAFSVPYAGESLPPFQIGYTPLPLTLSNCRDTTAEISDEAYEAYLSQTDFEAERTSQQDYSENTYANYRYYLEMLSSGLLRQSEEKAIVQLRENFGGELLGMTRLFERLDDWTAGDYARYLLANDRIDKYLLLYFAHFYYHGNPATGVYYEQVTFDGAVFAPDCVPSLLLIPQMTAWMFCFEPVDASAIYLLRAIPVEWYDSNTGFRARNLETTGGQFDVEIANNRERIVVKVNASIAADRKIYLDMRAAAELERVEGGTAEGCSRSGRYAISLQSGTPARFYFKKQL